MSQPLQPPQVSVICPTYRRQRRLQAVYQCFKAQTYPNCQLLIWDDSPEPLPFFQQLDDPSVRYIYERERKSSGEKRHRLIAEAEGELIAHFDDDDYYGPDYLSWMVAQLGDAQLVKLNAWYNYSLTHRLLAYWDTVNLAPMHYVLNPQSEALWLVESKTATADILHQNLWGYGFSYVYRRDAALATGFQDLNFGSDYQFVLGLQQADAKLIHVPDEQGRVLHVIHQANVSMVFPQYVMPPFLVYQLFGEAILPFLTPLQDG